MILPFPHQLNKQLSNFTTFGIGGPAHYFAQARSVEEMQEMVTFAYSKSLRTFILGKGSNTLFDDKGFNGLVILNKLDYLTQQENNFRVGSGFSFPRLGGLTARKGWSGLEFASGIPATVGGAIYMNAGANGKETADTLSEVLYLTERGELRILKKNELAFSYRHSPFQKWDGVAILEGAFTLTYNEAVKEKHKEILNHRLNTQPYKEKSAGCAFRNPIGISAGQLIDQCGLKGLAVGGAYISDKHANFIVNQGGAKAYEVLDLMKKIQEVVFEKKGILLKEEIRFVAYE